MLYLSHSSLSTEINGNVLYRKCSVCHGEFGEGSNASKVPKLASQHSWYIQKQLMDYKSKKRKNAQMHAFSKKLSDEEIKMISDYIQSLKVEKSHHSEKAQPHEKGRALYGQCIRCHGKKAQGAKENGVPLLAGQFKWYLEKQLMNIKNSKRDIHQMKPIMKDLTVEDIESLAQYLSELPINN